MRVLAKTDLEDVRQRIIKLARDKKCRIVPRNLPCRFTPNDVVNPNTGMYFDMVTAWYFIADLAESGHPIGEIMLDNPKGEKAYVMVVASEKDFSGVYIKVQLKGNMIYGRSFHIPLYDK